MHKVSAARSSRVAKSQVAPKHTKAATAKHTQAPRAKRDDFSSAKAKAHGSIDTAAIERELAAQPNAPQLKTSSQLLPNGAWNQKGNEPTPTFFADLGKPSDFWKAALKDPKLAKYAQPTPERTMLSLGSLERNAKGFEAEIQVYKNGREPSVRVQVPADAGLKQLVDDSTGRAPVLPLPLGIYTKEGSALGMDVSGAQLEGAADALGASKTQPLWSPHTETYDQIGTAKLSNLSILDVNVSIYGDVNISYRPEYDMGYLRMDPLSYKMMSPSDEQPRTKTMSAKDFLALPPFFAPLKAQVAKVLGD